MASGALSQSEQKSVKVAEDALAEANTLIDGFLSGPWKEYQAVLNKVDIPLDQIIGK
ncbi:MAG: hypothetical protein MZV63_04060 [Marinilabiliales bacterium]|nr:hypothetical protein [Marinilabiliales bacterium]